MRACRSTVTFSCLAAAVLALAATTISTAGPAKKQGKGGPALVQGQQAGAPAQDLSPAAGGIATGMVGSDCCVANGTPGCDDPVCEATICAVDAFCCDIFWDSVCADQADDLCAVCGGEFEDCNENGIEDDAETLPEYLPGKVEPTDSCDEAPFICPGYQYWGGNYGAERDTITRCGLLFGGQHDVFFAYRPKSDSQPGAPAEVRVCESSFDVIMSVHTDCPATEANQIACNFASAVGTNCGMLFPVEGGETYYIRIAGQANQVGEFMLELFGPDCLLNPNDVNEDGVPDDCQCLADVNGDGVVDGEDIELVLDATGAECPCDEDVDFDGDVDDDDLLIVYGSLGSCFDSDCCISNGSTGCDDAECEATVCALDFFCCNVAWDDLCAELAQDVCEVCGGDGKPFPPLPEQSAGRPGVGLRPLAPASKKKTGGQGAFGL